MIVPRYWAEARLPHVDAGQPRTIQRWGWSDESKEAAQAHAQSRANEAIAQLLAGKALPSRERKVAYNGADGVPIREEILHRFGEHIVTRNAYGAHCLNTPHLLFADVDDVEPPLRHSTVILILLVLFIDLQVYLWWDKALSIAICFALAVICVLIRRHLARQRGEVEIEGIVHGRLTRFLKEHPEWSLRSYRTPAGMRLAVTHRCFDPAEPDVTKFFHAVEADPIYARMCLRQGCFRARLTAKPWRIGLSSASAARPGVWPVSEDRLAALKVWAEAYELRARDFAACRFLTTYGRGHIDARLSEVLDYHDREARALETSLPLA